MALLSENYFKIGPYLGLFRGIHTALDINEGIIKVVGPDGAGKSSFALNWSKSSKPGGRKSFILSSLLYLQIISTNSFKTHLASIKTRILTGH